MMIIIIIIIIIIKYSRNGLRSVLFTHDWNYTIHIRLDEAVLL